MKTSLRLALILIIAIYGCSKAPVPTGSEIDDVAEFAALRIMTVDKDGAQVDGAAVFLNGELCGETPMTMDSVAYGTHAIRIQKQGYSIYSENVSLASNLLVTREVILKELPLNTGQLVLTVDQDSTQITITDSQNEIVDEDINRELSTVLEAGSYFVNCQKPGFGMVFKAIGIHADSITIENIALPKIANSNDAQIALIVPDEAIVDQPLLVSWESNNATSVDIDYIENPGLNGKREITFQTIGMHVLNAYAYNEGGKVTVKDSILVKAAPTTAPTIELAVSPKTAYVDDPVTLQWNTTNATSVDVDFVPNAGLQGQWQHVFTEVGEYIINAIAYGPGGQTQAVDTVTVISRDAVPPTITLTVTPDDVAINQPVTLSWESENATSVAVDFVPNAGLDGQWQTSFGSVGQFIVKAYAYGNGGQAVAIDTVNVTTVAEKTPTVWLQVNPETAVINQDVTISWGSQNAEKVDVDFVPNAGLNGQWNMSFSETGTYILKAVAYNGARQVQVADTVVIAETAAPSLTLSASATEIMFGTPVEIQWESNGEQVIIDQGVGVRGPAGTEALLFPNPGQKTITAVAYGTNNMKTTKQITVTILEPTQPELPVITLSVPDSVQTGKALQIEWHSWNATNVDVDFVMNPGLNGEREVAFVAAGQKIISATAYNDAGQVTVDDTIYVVEEEVTECNPPLIVPSGAGVCAYHYKYPQEIEDAGNVTVDKAGYYRVTATIFYNSGDDQKNESCYITVDNQSPMDPNAGDYKVIPDDPGTPHTADRDAGLFYMTAGSHVFQLHHYAKIADQYPQFVVDGPIDDAESVQLLYLQVEFVRQ